MSFYGSKDVIVWVCRCYFSGYKISFCGLKHVMFESKHVILWPLRFKIFSSKNIPFYWPTEVVILWVYRHHFVAVQLSSCGSKKFNSAGLKLTFLKMSFCGSKDVILRV